MLQEIFDEHAQVLEEARESLLPELQKAADLNTKSPEPCLELANTYYDLNDLEAAEEMESLFFLTHILTVLFYWLQRFWFVKELFNLVLSIH